MKGGGAKHEQKEHCGAVAMHGVIALCSYDNCVAQ
jgi:hypothetical protein